MLLPVRHHSPACARMVRDVIRQTKPALVLIEGPSDFNDRLDELYLNHQLPIAIYSFVAWKDGSRQGAYYPFCEFSPEWQALTEARACGAKVRFIDLPYSVMAKSDQRSHLYADDRLRSSEYVKELCNAFQVEKFDDAWDYMLEQDLKLPVQEIESRLGTYCKNLRALDEASISETDLHRERYMAAHIRTAIEEVGRERVIVVTGGYHTAGIEQLLANNQTDTDTHALLPAEVRVSGLALTPFSFQRLDSLVGYNAGMPSPGFYQQAWESLGTGEEVHAPLLGEIIKKLRAGKQIASTADLIGVEICARTLASLRNHTQVWRRDMMDAIVSVLLKDDFIHTHPFILVTQEILRGGRRGCLDSRCPLPPIVQDIRAQLAKFELEPDKIPREVSIELTAAPGLEKSHVLHRLQALSIPGFVKYGGVDFSNREDLSSLCEEWRVEWTAEQDAQMIESSRYGSALNEATSNCLAERAHQIERNSAVVTALLLDSVLCGIMALASDLRLRVIDVIRQDGNLGNVAQAMSHLLYLFSWDDLFGTRGNMAIGQLLKEAYDRAIWLLELGSPLASPKEEVYSIRMIRDVFEQAEPIMKLDRKEFAEVLARVQANDQRSPDQRGACAGAQWSLNCGDPESIHRDLLLFCSPENMGDFLTGLFALAREQCYRDERLLSSIYNAVKAWDADEFLAALPSLRLAFMFFTPREKIHIAESLFRQLQVAGETDMALPDLAVGIKEAARAMAFEQSLLDVAALYGIELNLTGD